MPGTAPVRSSGTRDGRAVDAAEPSRSGASASACATGLRPGRAGERSRTAAGASASERRTARSDSPARGRMCRLAERLVARAPAAQVRPIERQRLARGTRAARAASGSSRGGPRVGPQPRDGRVRPVRRASRACRAPAASNPSLTALLERRAATRAGRRPRRSEHARALRRQQQRAGEREPRRGHRRARSSTAAAASAASSGTMAEERQREVQRLVGHRPPDRRVGGVAERGQRRARRRGQVERDEEPQRSRSGAAARQQPPQQVQRDRGGALADRLAVAGDEHVAVRSARRRPPRRSGTPCRPASPASRRPGRRSR